MGVLYSIVNLLVVAVCSTVIILSLYHWLLAPIEILNAILNRIGLVIAFSGVLQSYAVITEIFISYYGESRYLISFLGEWYSSEDYPWLMYATSIPVVFISLLFWIPSVRSKPIPASILCLFLLAPSILGEFFPPDLSQV